MPSSHRRLVHRHAERILSGTPRDLAPGEARLYSFYAPSLTGGLHSVAVSQHLSAPPEPGSGETARRTDDIPELSQSFIVIAPRFSLAPGVVDSVYPTPGISVEHTILPHVVLKDPHLPWSRAPSHIPAGEDDNNVRSRNTWLALLAFTVGELESTGQQVRDALQKMPPDVERKQSEMCTLRMRARDTVNLSGIAGIVNTAGFSATLDARDAAEPCEVVLLPGGLFADLFLEPGAQQRDRLNVASYKHMAHVRQVATDGMAGAGADADEALFSVVVSRRTGPIGADNPSAMAAHLLSLSWDPNMPFPQAGDRVAVVSLHSWTYTCLPSLNAANTYAMLTNLGDHLAVLRTDDVRAVKKASDGEDDDAAAVEALVAARQRDGFTLARHRTVTGEVTASLVRGPLVPAQVDRPLRAGMCMQSNFGHDLAIFDPNFGLLDATYSAAWQLGRTLAMTDSAFCAALARLRNAVQAGGLDGAKREVHAAFGPDGYGSRPQAAANMLGLVRGLNRVNGRLHEHGGAATAVGENRWCWEHGEYEAAAGLASIDLLSLDSPHIASRLAAHSDAAALRFAMARKVEPTGAGEQEHKGLDEDEDAVMYNEHNLPVNQDYALVYSWVLDKVHLGNVPAHYLIPDPAFLPQETLRFFYVDANWTDALVDGALSLANHWGATPETDTARTAIKTAINKRLATPDASLGGWHVQMPRYGFLLRSRLLAQFPDMAVDVKFAATRSQPVEPGCPGASRVQPPAKTPAQQPILVQKRIAPDTMYLLFDAAPPDLQRITLTMPPHQQCFRAAQGLTDKQLTVVFKRLYTTTARPPDAQPGDTLGSEDLASRVPAVFEWPSRTLSPAVFGAHLVGVLKEKNKGYFDDDGIATSAVVALQLNDPILQLDIGDISARGVSEPVPLFQLSTPLPPENGRQGPPRLDPPLTRLVRPGPAVRRPRPASPTPDAHLLARFCESQASEAARQPRPVGPSPDPHITGPPSWKLRVYPVRSETRSFVPSASPHPIDLIFSLRANVVNQWTEPLTRILVGVPFGDVPADAETNPHAVVPLLARTSDPPVPTMLSNMRLNVLKRWGSDDDDDLRGCVVFELVPRQRPGAQVRLLADASFRLPRATIALWASNRPLQAHVKVLYEFLPPSGVPKRATFRDGASVELRSGP